MEYYYADLGQANADMRRWQVPATGERQFGTGTPGAPLEIVRSSVLGPQQLSAENTLNWQDAPIDSAVPQAWEPQTTRDDFDYRQQVRKHEALTAQGSAGGFQELRSDPNRITGVENQQGFQEGRI